MLKRCCCRGDVCDPVADYALTTAGHLGNFTLSDGTKFTATASGTEVTGTSETAIGDDVLPQNPYPADLYLTVKGGSGAEIELYVSWGATEGLVVLIEPGTPFSTHGTVTFYQRDGTRISEAMHFEGLVVDQWHETRVCYNPRTHNMTFYVKPYGESQWLHGPFYTPTDHTVGSKAGFGVGSGHTGTAYFKDYKLYPLWYCGDGTPDCEVEVDGALPAITYCSVCMPWTCYIQSPTYDAYWDEVSGTWTYTTGTGYGLFKTTSTDARQRSKYGDIAEYQKWFCRCYLPKAGTQFVFGMSDPSGDNQWYVVTEAEKHPTTSNSARVKTSVYSITAGGAPSLESGPSYSDYAGYLAEFLYVNGMILYDERQQRFAYYVLGSGSGWSAPPYYFNGSNVPTYPYYNQPLISERLTLPANTPMRRKVLGTGGTIYSGTPEISIANDTTNTGRCWGRQHAGSASNTCEHHYGTLRANVTIAGVTAGNYVYPSRYLGHSWFNDTFALSWESTPNGQDYGELGRSEFPGVVAYTHQETITATIYYYACYSEDADETTLYLTITHTQFVSDYDAAYPYAFTDSANVTTVARFEATLSGRVDTRTLSAQALTFGSATYSYVGVIDPETSPNYQFLDFSGATCTITADH